jgi:hypothetical protein
MFRIGDFYRFAYFIYGNSALKRPSLGLRELSPIEALITGWKGTASGLLFGNFATSIRIRAALSLCSVISLIREVV